MSYRTVIFIYNKILDIWSIKDRSRFKANTNKLTEIWIIWIIEKWKGFITVRDLTENCKTEIFFNSRWLTKKWKR